MTPEEEAGLQLIQSVNAELIDARHSYYVMNQPIMPDAIYDQKERNLKEMVAAMPQFRSEATVLTTIGSDLVRGAGQIRHRTPMLSLENHYTFDATQEWCSQFPAGTQFGLEPKVDGSSCSLLYLDRKLVKAATRGNGAYGEDITLQIAASGAVPLTLNPEFFPTTPVEIRGEVFITVGQFNRINTELEANGDKPYTSPRNLASGTLKLKDLQAVKHRGLRFFVWQVEGVPAEYLAKRQLDTTFAHHAVMYVTRVCPEFPQSIFSIAESPEQVVEFLDGRLRKERECVWLAGMGMQTDGIVIKIDNPQLRSQLGVGDHYPNWAIAWKYPSEKKGTVLKSVIWQTGRTGVFTPVGILEPINLGGALVQRVNLNNYAFIQELGIEIGDEVLMSRGGEVIPYCSGIAVKSATPTPIEPPTHCSCGTELVALTNEKSGVITHWCQNPECPARLQARLEYISSRAVLEIDDLGPELIKQLLDEGYVTATPDLFAFCQDIQLGLSKVGPEQVSTQMVARGFSAAQILSVAHGVERCKTYEWDRWLMALDLPNVGKVLAKTLATQCRLQPDDLPNVRTILLQILDGEKIEGIGEIRKADILEYFQANPSFDTEMATLYSYGVRPASLVKPATVSANTDQPLAGQVLCITGEFDAYGEREYLQECLASLGATIKSGVSKKLTMLLTGSAPGPSKITKARDLGVPTEGKKWLATVFETYGLTPKPKQSAMKFDDEDFA